MAELKFLGRGSCFTKNEINNSAYFIKDNILVLIDCGSDVFKKIINTDILHSKGVSKLLILITHMHDDHVGSLVSLLEYCKYSNTASNIEEVFIFDSFLDLIQCVPASAYKSRIDSYLSIYGMSLSILRKVKVVDKSYVKDNLNLEIIPVVVSHCELCYGYLIKDLSDNNYIYYSGDCNSHDPLFNCLNNLVNGDHIDIYLECSVFANGWVGSCHFAENRMPYIIREVSRMSKRIGFTYSIGIMHIEDYDLYSDLIKKLIVNTI